MSTNRTTFQERALAQGIRCRIGYMPDWWFDKNPFARKRLAQFDALMRGPLAPAHSFLKRWER